MKNSKILIIGTILLSGLLVMGISSCRILGNKSSKTTKVTTPSVKNYQAPDVPVPANFEHRPDKSWAYVTGSVRTTSIKYIGSARTEDLMEFYSKQMTKFNWMENRSYNPNPKESSLTIGFLKNHEQCLININQKGSETHLTIELGYGK
ncbi:MAG: hypothetical protein HZA49_06780 [Planctomycetes bacterium]|nr:hypothetical protein [Planctomycetota bacterium]